ncbi:MAG: hypothetical protein KAY37_03730 [Phycisphaerae bacterium]|nr:hypothetical protein [Phycisphaerae bacterium]
MIEVFFVDDSTETSIIRGTYQYRKRLRRDFGIHVVLLCHDFVDSRSRYAADVSSILASRPDGRGYTCVSRLLDVAENVTYVTDGGQAINVFMAATTGSRLNAFLIESDQWTKAA